MFDKDLATLYGVQPIRLREQVKRNIKRFPSDFMFQLNEKEVRAMVSHFAIPSRKHLGGHLPYAFTEHGILMLSNVLNSERAIEANIQIMKLSPSCGNSCVSIRICEKKLRTWRKNTITNSPPEAGPFFGGKVRIKELLEPPPQKSKRSIGFYP